MPRKCFKLWVPHLSTLLCFKHIASDVDFNIPDAQRHAELGLREDRHQNDQRFARLSFPVSDLLRSVSMVYVISSSKQISGVGRRLVRSCLLAVGKTSQACNESLESTNE